MIRGFDSAQYMSGDRKIQFTAYTSGGRAMAKWSASSARDAQAGKGARTSPELTSLDTRAAQGTDILAWHLGMAPSVSH